jgi:hypothetical protein
MSIRKNGSFRTTLIGIRFLEIENRFESIWIWVSFLNPVYDTSRFGYGFRSSTQPTILKVLSINQHTNYPRYSIAVGNKLMLQLELFDSQTIVSNQAVVNVSSVPQRSPFRYAGGKTWLVPRIRQWLHYQGDSSEGTD